MHICISTPLDMIIHCWKEIKACDVKLEVFARNNLCVCLILSVAPFVILDFVIAEVLLALICWFQIWAILKEAHSVFHKKYHIKTSMNKLLIIIICYIRNIYYLMQEGVFKMHAIYLKIIHKSNLPLSTVDHVMAVVRCAHQRAAITQGTLTWKYTVWINI